MGKEEIVNFLCLILGIKTTNLRKLIGCYNQKFPGEEASTLLLLKKMEEETTTLDEICNLFYLMIINYIKSTVQMTD